MDFLAFIIVGLLAGWFAGLIFRGRGFGFIGNLVIGVVGALIGGFIIGLFGEESEGFLESLVTSIIGALVLLAILNALSTKRV